MFVEHQAKLGPNRQQMGKQGDQDDPRQRERRLRTGNVLELMGAECVLKREARREQLNFKSAFECTQNKEVCDLEWVFKG